MGRRRERERERRDILCYIREREGGGMVERLSGGESLFIVFRWRANSDSVSTEYSVLICN